QVCTLGIEHCDPIVTAHANEAPKGRLSPANSFRVVCQHRLDAIAEQCSYQELPLRAGVHGELPGYAVINKLLRDLVARAIRERHARLTLHRNPGFVLPIIPASSK